MKKPVYSAVKDNPKRNKRHFFYGIVKFFLKIFFPKNKFVWLTEKPQDNEPHIFVCNHTRVYALVAWLLRKDKPKLWANYYFLFKKDCKKHLLGKVIKGQKHEKLLGVLGRLLIPVVVKLFRGAEPIPVYHDTRLTTTFDKSIQCLEAGITQVIFPEKTEPQFSEYLMEFNHGFPLVAKAYYDLTGKILKFYPCYCAPSLRKIVIGDPVSFDPNVPLKPQRQSICRYLEAKITEIARSLPEHKQTVYR